MFVSFIKELAVYEGIIITVVGTLLALIIGVIGWLLSDKDKKQAAELLELKKEAVASEVAWKAEIHLLYKLAASNKELVTTLRLDMAERYAKKQELEVRFAHLDNTIKDGFKELGSDLKEALGTFNKHVQDAKVHVHPNNVQ